MIETLTQNANFQEHSESDSGLHLIRTWVKKKKEVMRKQGSNAEVERVWSNGGEVREAVRKRFYFTRREKHIEALDFYKKPRLSIAWSAVGLCPTHWSLGSRSLSSFPDSIADSFGNIILFTDFYRPCLWIWIQNESLAGNP